MNSVIISYSKSLTSVGSPSGTVNFDTPVRTDGRRIRKLRLIKTSFSSLITNVFNHNGVNNGLVAVTCDGGTSWTEIQLPNGVYTVSLINAAINTTIAGWWADAGKPGFTLRYNLASQLAYVNIDSTKLAAPGQLGINFAPVGSRMWELLGYNQDDAVFVTDDLHGAQNYAKMNWFGDSVSLVIRGLGSLSLKNGSKSEELCSIPLSASSVNNEYIYPQGIYTPVIYLPGAPDALSTITFEFLGSRSDGGQQIPILILEGNVEVVIEYTWE